jgi:hypothetical protein
MNSLKSNGKDNDILNRYVSTWETHKYWAYKSEKDISPIYKTFNIFINNGKERKKMIPIKYLVTCLLLIASSGALAAPPTFPLPHDQWQMIALPATPPANANTVEKILGDNMAGGGDYGQNWVVYAYDTASNGYGSALALTDTMEVGKGYWIIQNFKEGGVTLDMPENSAETPASELIPLAASKDDSNQWNLAGNPFSTSLAMGDLRLKTNAPSCNDGSCDLDKAQANNLTHNKVWTYNGNSYEEKGTSDRIDAWAGFWVATLSGSKDYSIALRYGDNNVSNDSQFVYQDNEIEIDIKDEGKHVAIWKTSKPIFDLITAYWGAEFFTPKNDLDIKYKILKKTGGFDVEYTIRNKTSNSTNLSALKIPGIELGNTNTLKILNPLFKHYLEDRDLAVEQKYQNVEGHQRETRNDGKRFFNVANFVRTVNNISYEGHSPYGGQFVYSPVILATDSNFSVGTSLNLNYTKTKYRLKPYMRIVKEEGNRWAYEYDLSNSTIGEKEVLNLTLSVRFSRNDKWIFTLYPYKSFLNEYLVSGERKIPENKDLRPIQTIEMGGFGHDEEFGRRHWSPDISQWKKYDGDDYVVNLKSFLEAKGNKLKNNGFKRTAFWNFTGLYDNNETNTNDGPMMQQLPFQFAAKEILPVGMRQDMNDLEEDGDHPFKQFDVGYDWGISGNIPVDSNGDVLGINQWQPANIKKFDLGDPQHVQYAQYYLDKTKNLKGLFKPKFIRLDAFVRMDKDRGYDSRIKWLKHLQSSLPEVTFAAESSIDYMHARTADILQPDSIAWKKIGTKEEHNLTQPDMLAHYLNPGAETYVWLNANAQRNNKDLRGNIKAYIQSLISNGYTPLIDYWDVIDVNGIDTTVPECMNGKDSDNDGKIDWPYDMGCSSPSDKTESN